MLALTNQSIVQHAREIVPGGGILFDSTLSVDETVLTETSVQLFSMPLSRIAEEEGGNSVMANTAAVAAAAGLTGYGLDIVSSVIRDNFGTKGSTVVDNNLKVAVAAHRFARDHADSFPYKLRTRSSPPRMLINGNEALAMGALLGGCKFVAGYPMTPGSPILEWLSMHSEEYGIVTKHAEDEIAAVNMIIGAGHMGVRAMAPTSGGGFSLMVEGLGLAGITETPIVVVNAQRPGPATGLATRTEQGDLLFMIYASQGEFPRIVLAPGTIEQCFEAGYRAFNLAEKYQCPAIILTDAFLAHSPRSLDPEALNMAVPVDRGVKLGDEELDKLAERYRRYAFTKSGVSPRAFPGHPRAIHAPASDEHDEYGQICEDASNRTSMVEKRMSKLQAAQAEMRAPEHYGPREAEYTLVTWGSAHGPVRAAVDILNTEGTAANMVHIMDIWPLPVSKVKSALRNATNLVCVEQNYAGQLAMLLRAYAGIAVHSLITKYDGRPMSPEYILAKLREVA
jgi:2-oxoglutarate ferredoxin oxidoreductase subunit alpha